MVMLPAATWRWSLENGRSIGVGIATLAVVLLRVNGETDLDVLGLLAIVFPALEVVMFAAVFAFYLDGENDANEAAGTRSVEAMVAWGVVVFALMWGNIALVRLGIDAYVSLGVPPIWDAAI